MSGSNRYQRSGQRSVVAVANERVSIIAVCREIGVSLPDGVPEQRSVKVHCPFGAFYHADGGMETALRVYPSTNSAYCFAGCGYFSPVWLFAQARDLSSREAALQLLDGIGYRPLDLIAQWDQAREPTEAIDKDSLSEALKVYCSRLDLEWNDRQYDPGVSRTLSRCLELLSRVVTSEDAALWLEHTKLVMTRALSERRV